MTPHSGPPDAMLEEIFGQLFFAIGVGSGPIHIRRDAVRAFIDHYKKHFIDVLSESPDEWEKTGSCALDHAQIVGRLCAGFAAEEGAISISPTHMEKACRIVDGAPKRVIVHPWCV